MSEGAKGEVGAVPWQRLVAQHPDRKANPEHLSIPDTGFEASVIFNKHSITVCFMSSMVVPLCRFNTALKLHVIPSDGGAAIKVALLMCDSSREGASGSGGEAVCWEVN